MSGLTLTKDVLTDFGYTIRSEEIDLSNMGSATSTSTLSKSTSS